MSAFWNKNEKDKAKDAKSSQKKAKSKKPAVAKKAKSKKNFTTPKNKAALINNVLVKPKISEAALSGQDKGRYVFIVAKSANKSAVKEAVAQMYGVAVKKVNLINYKPKARGFRGFKGTNQGYKKAFVTLVEGQKLDFFSTKK